MPIPSWLPWAALTPLAFGLPGCGRPRSPEVAQAPAAEAAAEEAAYLAPPRVTAASGGGDRMVRVEGVAPPRSQVQIASPEGQQASAQADAQGRWQLALAPASSPRLYAVSATLAGRAVHAEGALVSAPGALAQAVVVRAGYAALPLASPGSTEIDTVDYDPAGFVAVAGAAPPRAALSLSVDGAPAAVGQAGADGRYAIVATGRRLTLGAHELAVRGPDRATVRRIALVAPAPLSAPYQAWRTDEGWRVEWALNGGGVQTTLILTP